VKVRELGNKLALAGEEIAKLKRTVEIRTKRWKKNREKLLTLEQDQKKLKEEAENKQVSLSLFKYKIKKGHEDDNGDVSLRKAIKEPSNSMLENIAKAQNHLGVKDLTQITTTHKMPPGKTLTDLITFYENNKGNSPTPLTQTRIITKLEPQEPNETIIVNQIIDECDLGLSENSTLTQVINRIKKLNKAKPPTVQTVIKNDTPFGEELAVIKQLELSSLTKLFGAAVDLAIQKQIQEATNYSQVVQARQDFLAKHLTPQSSSTTPTPTKPNPL
jgi:hypothetical protein